MAGWLEAVHLSVPWGPGQEQILVPRQPPAPPSLGPGKACAVKGYSCN